MIDGVATIAAVPVRDQIHYTRNVIDDLRREPVDGILVLDNGSTDGTKEYLEAVALEDRRVIRFDRPQARIYDLWNEAFRTARLWWTGVPVNLLLLNNDVRLWHGMTEVLARTVRSKDDAWIASPDPHRSVSAGPRMVGGSPSFSPIEVAGTYRHGGILGYAFLAAAEKFTDPAIDSGFEWWYGDDDLVFRAIDNGGKCYRVQGLPIDHVGEGTARHDPTRGEKIRRDEEHFRKIWGDR